MAGYLNLNKELKEKLNDTFRKIDDDMKELEELHKEMDIMLYDIERRIARMKHSGRA